MNKASESFGEHESKTAPGKEGAAPTAPAYGADVRDRPDSANQTRKMPKAALEHVLRTASGTRPAASAHDRARLANVIAEQLRDDPEAHGRPTLTDPREAGQAALSLPTPLAFVPVPPEATVNEPRSVTSPVAAGGLPSAPSAPAASPAPLEPRLAPSAAEATTHRLVAPRRVPGWAFGVGMFVLVVLLSAAGAVGYYFGRLSVLP